MHEWSHNEFRHRLQGQPVPDWFNEGVATYISGEPVCSEPPKQVIRLAELERGWTTFTDDVNKRDDTYCTARNEVAVWISLHKKEGLFRLLRDIAARTHDFRSAYGAIISQ